MSEDEPFPGMEPPGSGAEWSLNPTLRLFSYLTPSLSGTRSLEQAGLTRTASLPDATPHLPHRRSWNRSEEQFGLSVVVPAFNEEKRIANSLKRLAAYLDTLPFNCELIVVDDGSGPAGSQALQASVAALETNVSCRLLRHEVNRGKGAAVRTGCLAASGSYVAFIDADLATPPEALKDVVEALEDGADVALGTRLQTDGSDMRDRRSLKRRLAGRLYTTAMRLLLLPELSDSQCPMKAFRGEASKQIFGLQRIETWSFDAELLYISRQLGMKMTEVPVRWLDVEGSHVRLIRGLSELANLVRIRWIHRGLGCRPGVASQVHAETRP